MELVHNTIPRIVSTAVSIFSFIWRLTPSLKQTKLLTANQEPDVLSLITDCETWRIKLLTQFDNVPKKKKKNILEIIVSLNDILLTLSTLHPLLDKIRALAPDYDFPGALPANGYRSFLTIADKAIKTSSEIVQECHNECDSTCIRELSDLSQYFTSLTQCFELLVRFKSLSKDGSLYASEGISIEEIIEAAKGIDQNCFYGRFLANAFEDAIQPILKFISLAMVTYSELYYGPVYRVLNSMVYAFNDKARADRHIALTHHANVEFVTSFWAQSESPFCILPMRASNPVAVSEEVRFWEGKVCVGSVTVSAAYWDSPMVKGRLISSCVRKGMAKSSITSHPKSRGLIIHVHGGGFVSQSSQSQEIFLRKWATKLKVPIFSIDYSLAPDAQFPRPVHEVFFGYCSALANASLLGSTGERVVMVGDSAGANLILAAIFECIEQQVRLPDGLALSYVPVLVNFVPSPARLLGLMDPLLPFGIMLRCAKAYIKGENKNEDSGQPQDCISSNSRDLCAVCNNTITDPRMECIRLPFLVSVPEDPHISPYLAPDCLLTRLPPTALYTSTFDPCLDDTIMFARKIRSLGGQVSLDIVEGLPHGFFNFCGVNEKAAKCVENCGKQIATFLDLSTLPVEDENS